MHTARSVRALTIAMLMGTSVSAFAADRAPPVGIATKATADANARVGQILPLNDQADFLDATRRRLAQIEGGIIRNAKGETVWDAGSYAFIKGDAPTTVNPSLWRQSKLNSEHGLFEVMPGIYQFRGYDISVMTIIRGKTGWIIVDPLTAVESAAAGLALVNKTLGARPVSGIVFTHSHGDHFGGVNALAKAEVLASGSIPIVAPHGFIVEAVSENVIAGNYMSRRATFQFGNGLPRSAAAQVGTGLGQALPANGTSSLAKPTLEVGPGAAPVVIDGVTFEFIDAANSEAPAEFMFYLPEFKALCSAEVATGTFHNVLTQRGAKVRDTLGWSKSIDGALRQYGDKSDVVFGSHNWPTWGGDNVRTFLTHHRDTYRFIHDQTMRRANSGETATEIAENIGEPSFSKSDFSTRGYYGTINHNAKAVFQNYFGWWDGVPANYNAHTPVEAAKRYVSAMGGTKKALKSGIAAFDAGDYRWSSTVFNHLVFADPANTSARTWLAASYEQQGFQAEAGSWRNYFLQAARELRDGPAKPSLTVGGLGVLRAVPTANLMDALAARYNPAKSTRAGTTVQFIFTDRNEAIGFHVGKDVLFPRVGETLANPTATLTTTRKVFDTLMVGLAHIPDAMAAGDLKVSGDAGALLAMMQSLEAPSPGFNVVTP
ncbi:MAG: alkyl sulfatase dimerization domain-containing protein [Chakrabartia sp.]